MTQNLTQKRNYHSYRVNGKFAKKPQSKPQVISIPENHLVLVVDESGSMCGLNTKVIEFVNQWIYDNKIESSKFGQQTYVSLICYSSLVRKIFTNVRIQDVKYFKNYNPGSSTALFQAQQEAIFDLELIKGGPNTSFLVNHITDGEENMSWGGASSYDYYGYGTKADDYQQKIKSVVDKMLKKQQLGNWTFTFLLPPGKKQAFISRYGLEAGNIMEWETTEQGLYKASEETTSGLFNYYQTRSVGGQSVKNFYDVKVDLSKVSNLTKQPGLTDLSKKYQKFYVDKEIAIKDFVETSLGRNYKQGMCFYQLTKTETVQPNKDVLVLSKDDNKIYGGSEARHLIGLPDNQYAKVDPYNLGNKQIFIKSTSVNRILVRGTDVLVEK